MTEDLRIPRPILVVYQDDQLSNADGSKGVFSRATEQMARVAPLNLAEFTDNLHALCSQLGEVFDAVNLQVHNYELETIELTVDVTAKGEVKFIGSVGTEFKGGLTLSFHRANK